MPLVRRYSRLTWGANKGRGRLLNFSDALLPEFVKIFLVIIIANSTTIFQVTNVYLVQIILLLIGQGSRPLPCIGCTNFQIIHYPTLLWISKTKSASHWVILLHMWWVWVAKKGQIKKSYRRSFGINNKKSQFFNKYKIWEAFKTFRNLSRLFFGTRFVHFFILEINLVIPSLKRRKYRDLSSYCILLKGTQDWEFFWLRF